MYKRQIAFTQLPCIIFLKPVAKKRCLCYNISEYPTSVWN